MPVLRLLAPILIFAGMLAAQTTWITARVSSDPAGATVRVDGVAYTEAAAFFWRPGSTHVLSADGGQNFDVSGTRITFVGWTDSTGHDYGAATSITVIANPSVYFYRAVFDIQYAVDLQYFVCDNWSLAACPASPGIIYVNGTGYYKNSRAWFPAGELMTITAVPQPGWAFTGWENAFARPGEPLQSFTLTAPIVLLPQFRHSGNVTITSEPAGMKVSIDGAVVYAPQTYAWAVDSTHLLRPVSPQEDAAGHAWFFHGWSNGGAEEQSYTVPRVVDRQTVTAAYVRGAVVTVLADPFSIKLNVDGSSAWPGFNFVWAVGSTHRLEAPPEPVDAAGRHYRFVGWSDGVTEAARELTVNAAAVEEGQRLVARFELLGRLSVESTPPGIPMTVAGAACVTPCVLHRGAGTAVGVVAPDVSPLTADSRLGFEAWQDGAARERSYTFTTADHKITASYRTLYRVRAAADPEGGATFTFAPASDDQFYASGTQLQVTATAAAGFRFRRWGGDLEGTSPNGVLEVGAPRALIAHMDTVPYIAPAGVVNAAGPTPVDGVAAGSILAIYGVHLAPTTVVGPANPLAQSLAGVTVQVTGRLLPLFFVSPGQINALVPSDLALASHSVTVRSSGQPDVTALLRVVRNAPGLFSNAVDAVPYGVALRADGTPVLPSSPARPGETLTLYGTGFGPYRPSPLDGFSVPEGMEFPLVDSVQLLLGDAAVAPARAVAATGMVGVVAITFQVPSTASGLVTLKARVNGADSNTVTLPVTSGR